MRLFKSAFAGIQNKRIPLPCWFYTIFFIKF